MIIVNSPGYDTHYTWLGHAAWNGCTLADLVFPFFIFILGASIPFALLKAKKTSNTKQMVYKVFVRSVVLFLIGVSLNAFPDHFNLNTLRFFGVLQRIAICYCIAAFFYMTMQVRTQALIMVLLMVGYWIILTLFPETYDLTPEGNIAAYLDRQLFNAVQLYGKTYDPEGLLSTLPAIATALLGNLTGSWLLSNRTVNNKLQGMVILGLLLMLLGWLWGGWLPFNKSLWTSSYVLWTGGFAMLGLAFCYWLIEIKGVKRWSRPFEIFGINAIIAFVLHVFFLKLQAKILMPAPYGGTYSLRSYITDHWLHWISLKNASLLYALSYTMLWLTVIWFIGLQKTFFFRRKT